MRDWDDNGEMDYWDDVVYLENFERENNDTGNSWEEKYGNPSKSKFHVNGSFILEMIIALVVVSILEVVFEPLAFLFLIIFAVAEFNIK